MAIEPRKPGEPLAQLAIVNATGEPIDVYLNGISQPQETGIMPRTVGPTILIDGTLERPFQVYTVQIREREDIGGPILAEASINMVDGEAYTAVFRTDGQGGMKLSIFPIDFAETDQSRLQVVQVSSLDTVFWKALAKQGNDDRKGTLARGEFQIAKELRPAAYTLRAESGGNIVAELKDVTLDSSRMRIAYLVGEPAPACRKEKLSRFWITQEVLLPSGSGGAASTTPPARAISDTDTNKPIEVDFPDLELVETNSGQMNFQATDPDGFIQQIELLRAVPDLGSIALPPLSISTSASKGAPAEASVDVGGDLPYGSYWVTLRLNNATFAEPKRATARIDVLPVTVDRLRSEISRHRANGDVSTALAADFLGLLDEADQQITADNFVDASVTLQEYVDLAAQKSGGAIPTAVATDIEREGRALLLCFTPG